MVRHRLRIVVRNRKCGDILQLYCLSCFKNELIRISITHDIVQAYSEIRIDGIICKYYKKVIIHVVDLMGSEMYSVQGQGAAGRSNTGQPEFYAPALQFPQLNTGFGMGGMGGRSMGSALSFVPPPLQQKAAAQ